MKKPKIIAIVGPTASGKSALGIFLAQKIGGEIISADSRQVYRGLDIGTGKVTEKEMSGVPHHLLDVASPQKIFSADDFVRLANTAIEKIGKNGCLPVVVGGTGFYIDALLGRLTLPNVPPDEKLRAQLDKKSPKQLFVMLKKLDPRRAKTIEPHHKRRLIRAIEIARALGKNPVPKTQEKYQVLWLGVALSPDRLKKNIHTRLLSRVKAGMIREARLLYRQGVSYTRMEELGLEYRSLARLLQKKISHEEFLAQLEREINKYAKRQYRWFKRNPDIRWVKSKTEALSFAKKFLKNLSGR
jgi:tRNA dimethylallyltransferase